MKTFKLIVFIMNTVATASGAIFFVTGLISANIFNIRIGLLALLIFGLNTRVMAIIDHSDIRFLGLLVCFLNFFLAICAASAFIRGIFIGDVEEIRYALPALIFFSSSGYVLINENED